MAGKKLEDQVLEVVRKRDGVRLGELTQQIAAASEGEPDIEAKTKREALRLIDQGLLRVDYEYKLHLASAG